MVLPTASDEFKGSERSREHGEHLSSELNVTNVPHPHISGPLPMPSYLLQNYLITLKIATVAEDVLKVTVAKTLPEISGNNLFFTTPLRRDRKLPPEQQNLQNAFVSDIRTRFENEYRWLCGR